MLVCALLAGIWFHGKSTGEARQRAIYEQQLADLQDRFDRLSDAARKAAEDLRKERELAAAQQQEREDEINQADDGDLLAFPDEWMRRIGNSGRRKD